MAQGNVPDLPPLFDFDPAASKEQALGELMLNAIVEAVQPDKDVGLEDTFQDYHSAMVCRALAGIIAESLSWLALSAQQREDRDELYEEFLAQLRVHWKDPNSSLPTEH